MLLSLLVSDFCISRALLRGMAYQRDSLEEWRINYGLTMSISTALAGRPATSRRVLLLTPGLDSQVGREPSSVAPRPRTGSGGAREQDRLLLTLPGRPCVRGAPETTSLLLEDTQRGAGRKLEDSALRCLLFSSFSHQGRGGGHFHFPGGDYASEKLGLAQFTEPARKRDGVKLS